MNSVLLLMTIVGVASIVAAYFALKSNNHKKHSH